MTDAFCFLHATTAVAEVRIKMMARFFNCYGYLDHKIRPIIQLIKKFSGFSRETPFFRKTYIDLLKKTRLNIADFSFVIKWFTLDYK